MNASKRSEGRQETDHVREHRTNLGVDTVLEEDRPNSQTPPWNPVGSYVPDEGAVETFVDGTGI
jgi:hypothetical protein